MHCLCMHCVYVRIYCQWILCVCTYISSMYIVCMCVYIVCMYVYCACLSVRYIEDHVVIDWRFQRNLAEYTRRDFHVGTYLPTTYSSKVENIFSFTF